MRRTGRAEIDTLREKLVNRCEGPLGVTTVWLAMADREPLCEDVDESRRRNRCYVKGRTPVGRARLCDATELQSGSDQPTTEDDVEHGQLAVPAVEGEECRCREERGGHVDDAGVEDVYCHRCDQAYHTGGDPE